MEGWGKRLQELRSAPRKDYVHEWSLVLLTTHFQNLLLTKPRNPPYSTTRLSKVFLRVDCRVFPDDWRAIKFYTLINLMGFGNLHRRHPSR